MIGEFDPQAAITALQGRGVTGATPCPMCGAANWSLTRDGFWELNTDESSAVNGQVTTLATVGLVCQQCGFVSLHSTRVLHLVLPSDVPGETR